VVPVRQHYNITLAILTTAGTAFALQQTLVFPALPTFARELDTTTAWATWVLTIFLVSASVLTPVLGRLGDQYGKERMLVVSLSIFVLGCIGAAFAWDIWSLIAFRAISGAGGAVFPLSFGIIRDEFPPEKVKVAMGLLSSVFGVGGGLGIVLSGVVVDNVSWRWLFVLGAVPVAFAIWLVHRYIPESPVRAKAGVDVPGALLLSGALVSFLLALTEGESWGWTSAPVLGLLVLSGALLVSWVEVERRVPEPMVDMRMMAFRPVLLTNVTTLIAGFAMFGTFVLVPLLVQTDPSWGYGFGASATESGLYLLPSSLMMLVAGPLGGVLGQRYGSALPLAAGMAILSAGALVLAAWHDRSWQIVAAMVLVGVGVAFAFSAMAALIAENVRPTETGVATGMNTVMRTVGAVIGGQLGAALLTARTIGDTAIPTESAYTITFGLSAGAALAAAAVALLIAPAARRPQLAPAEAHER
jgi:EmrB/QacA subfamily drug resistance transporter